MSDLIEKLSNLRSQFNCFDENERDAYNTLSEAIKVITEQPESCKDTVSRRKLLNDLKKLKIAWKKYPVMAEQIKGVETAIEYVEMIPSVAPKQEPCDDAVSRESVSKWLKQYGQDVIHGKYKFSLMYIWKNLMDLPSVTPKPHWIPVTERLPNDDVEVIVSCTDDSGDTSFSYTTVAWHFNGTWICDNERCFFITAWMPLPEPYRAERRTDELGDS